MIKFPVNKNNNNEHCYQVNGIINNAGKEIQTRFIVWADSENEAKDVLKAYQMARKVKYNLQTLADAQKAYKKQFGVEAELDSVEFLKFIK